ncbi:MAG: hypothetical protein ACP59X_14300 [Solidesulfovibrio sp. DCME]|uniref:hypothetical protein n=1 Tax=Solidesulfovibrio sp. DCME TaxID=3447380 RepID=UPI003D0D4768
MKRTFVCLALSICVLSYSTSAHALWVTVSNGNSYFGSTPTASTLSALAATTPSLPSASADATASSHDLSSFWDMFMAMF